MLTPRLTVSLLLTSAAMALLPVNVAWACDPAQFGSVRCPDQSYASTFGDPDEHTSVADDTSGGRLEIDPSVLDPSEPDPREPADPPPVSEPSEPGDPGPSTSADRAPGYARSESSPADVDDEYEDEVYDNEANTEVAYDDAGPISAGRDGSGTSLTAAVMIQALGLVAAAAGVGFVAARRRRGDRTS